MSAAGVWIAIGATAAGCYLVKLLGLSVPAGALERPLVRRLAALLPVALLAALTAQQTFGGEGGALVADARAGGLAAAAVALVLRAPFLVVVAAAVLVTAGLRALG
ncbi:AzlD domain-containing protein [Streptomyces chitinivorans]|uniref:AzlD domain-containing protein n=1 Tax=Streptomyces chitinivorans TaxID=1257027 RepID=A0ABW7HME1_9ACTN|nr:AzlD domain-containing protein [Streptomyces chitinivorans]MDH2410880.1 AzlD domain-containing protein [Streptomyces chitinivorans]